MSKLTENIKKFRVFRKLTQSELAYLLGKTKNVISNWERGENSPDPDTVEKICLLLNVTPNQIYGWDVMPEYEEYIRYMQHKEEELSHLEDEKKKIQSRINKTKKEMEEFYNCED